MAMADLEVENGSALLSPAKANGHVPSFDDAADMVGTEPVEQDEAPEVGVPDGEDTSANNKIYFIRIPRPPINDEAVKKLSVQFTEHVAKLKGMNAELAAKRVSIGAISNPARGYITLRSL